MKKSYIMPAIIIVNLKSVKLLDGSSEHITVGAQMVSGPADSRRGGADWDDEEE